MSEDVKILWGFPIALLRTRSAMKKKIRKFILIDVADTLAIL